MRKLLLLCLLLLLPIGCTKAPDRINPPVKEYTDFNLYMNDIQKEAKDRGGLFSWITPTGSMLPYIQDYDWVIILPADKAPFEDLQIGDIVAYNATWVTDDITKVLHRITGKDQWGWIVGGDNNPVNDPNVHLTKENYLGKCVTIYRFHHIQ